MILNRQTKRRLTLGLIQQAMAFNYSAIDSVQEAMEVSIQIFGKDPRNVDTSAATPAMIGKWKQLAKHMDDILFTLQALEDHSWIFYMDFEPCHPDGSGGKLVSRSVSELRRSFGGDDCWRILARKLGAKDWQDLTGVQLISAVMRSPIISDFEVVLNSVYLAEDLMLNSNTLTIDKEGRDRLVKHLGHSCRKFDRNLVVQQIHQIRNSNPFI